MKNKPISIETTAVDTGTNTHQGSFSEDAEIRDKVVITGLYNDRVYRVTGRLIDKKTKDVLKDREGNDVIASKEFTATGDAMEIELSFTVDASQFTKETTTVAFERLERISKVHELEADVVPVEIAKHEDPDDEDQTIHYGGIMRTVATNRFLISHNILGIKNAVIADTVEYKNLSTRESYTLQGELYDKTTGQLTGIRASMILQPKTADGSVIVRFKFDASEYADHDLVVFETLSVNGTVIDEHNDINDQDQTVHVRVIILPPKTGDNSRLRLYVILFMGALAVLASFVIKEGIRSIKQRREDEQILV